MAALLSISIWVALATVVPGLVTIAAVFGAVAVVGDGRVGPVAETVPGDLVWLAIAVAVMVVTQTAGILLEEKVLVPRRWLGRRAADDEVALRFPEGGEERFDPYEEYRSLYGQLARLREADDPRGHVERALAQFFLSVNTLVSFAAGIVAALLVAAVEAEPGAAARAGLYAAGLAAALALGYGAAVSRFEIVAKSLRAVRRVRDEAPVRPGP